MRRLARLPLALLAAAGLGLGALLPAHTHSAKALDFWDWDAPASSSAPTDGGQQSGTPTVDHPQPGKEKPVIGPAAAPPATRSGDKGDGRNGR